MLLIGFIDAAWSQPVPLPRPRPAGTAAVEASRDSKPEEAAAPSACRLRLTNALAVAPSLPAQIGPHECGIDDPVQLESVVLPDKSHVSVVPPAILRCEFAEAIVQWVREDVAPAARAFKSPLRSIDNYASYDCRGQNRIVGARLSEHGKANALDVRSLKLADGTIVRLADPHVAKDFREGLRKVSCARFSTVLGPGSDGYHEDHIHLDLAERRGGYRICHWDVREPGEEAAPSAAEVPLPRPRPGRG
jgi:hypothetical protein